MFALAQQTAPVSTLPGGVDAGQAVTFFQWLESRGPYALVALLVVTAFACSIYWIPRWFNRAFDTWEKAQLARAEEHKADRALLADSMAAQQQRHLNFVETVTREGQANREAFREEREACDARARQQAESSRRDVENLASRLADELRRALGPGAR